MPITQTPLRYPGGKSQMTDFVNNLLKENCLRNVTYIEPFSGGAGVSLKLLIDNNVNKIIINDFDPSIHAIWYSILNNHEELIQLIQDTPITIEEWRKQKIIHKLNKNDPYSILNGFSTLFLNRTNRNGIINAGVIGGIEQNGNSKIDCRFNKTDIIKKIYTIHNLRERILLYNLDALELIKNVIYELNPKETFCFFDPPYYEQGKKLYTNFFVHSDHVQLANEIKKLKDFYLITTYDYKDEIKKIYSDFDQYEYMIRYSANKKILKKEYLFSNSTTRIVNYKNIVIEHVK